MSASWLIRPIGAYVPLGSTPVQPRAWKGQANRPGMERRRIGPLRRAGCRGFTLLEVLLALGLTLVVLMAVGMAVDFFIRGIETSRAAVEEAQLARALLSRIAEDLRGAVRYDPINAEQLLSGTASNMFSGGANGLASGSSLPSEFASSGSSSDLSSLLSAADASALESAANSSSGTNSTTPRALPGLYGTRTELQVDVARLPRLDQYAYELIPASDSPVVDRLSDVKTVTYYVLDAAGGETPAGQPRRGLVRAELDRAVTAYSAETGSLDPALEFEPIAPEVAAVEFQYFDGQQWYDTWDCQEAQGLPVAVQVTLYLYPAELRRGGLAWLESTSPYLDSSNFVAYSLLVRLPGSEPATGQTGSTASESSTSPSSDEGAGGATGGGSSASGSAGGPGGGPGAGASGGAAGGAAGGAGGAPGRSSGPAGTFNPFSGTTSEGGSFGGKSR